MLLPAITRETLGWLGALLNERIQLHPVEATEHRDREQIAGHPGRDADAPRRTRQLLWKFLVGARTVRAHELLSPER
jgi:hypothetical protein